MLKDSNNLFQKTKKKLVEMNNDNKVKTNSIQKDWRMQMRTSCMSFPEKKSETEYTGIITFWLRSADTAFKKKNKQIEALWQPCIHNQVRVSIFLAKKNNNNNLIKVCILVFEL